MSFSILRQARSRPFACLALAALVAAPLTAQGASKRAQRTAKAKVADAAAAAKSALSPHSPRRLPGAGSTRARVPGLGGSILAAAGIERELNDTPARADSFGTMTDMDGTIASSTDQDVYRLQVPAHAYVTLSISARGAMPIVDPALLVTDAAGQFLLFADDDATTLFPNLTVPMPAGTYYLNVFEITGGVGDYRVSAIQTQTTFPVIVSGTPVNGTLAASRDNAYRLIVPQDSHVALKTSGGSLDLFTVVLLPGGAQYRYVDDSSAGLDPALDTHLPAGLYTLLIGELSGAAGQFSFTATITPAPITSAPCGTSATGVVQGDETLALYRLQLSSRQHVSFATGGSGTSPLMDTILHLHDASLNRIFAQDDDGTSTWSRIDVPLPAGTYYLGVEPYPFSTSGPEGFSLTGTCGGAVTAPPAPFGRSAGSVAANHATAAFLVDIGTPQPVQVAIDTSNGTLPDPQLAVLDAKGALVAMNDDSTFGTDSFAGAATAPSTHWVLVREYGNGTGTFELHVRPILFFSDTITNRTLNLNDEAGRNVHAFVGLKALPVPVPLPAPISGNLLLDLNPHIYLGSQPVPASGVATWPINFQPFPVLVQGVAHDAAAGLLLMTELVR